jgi:phage-related protein
MPFTNVHFFQDAIGKVPVLEWLTELKQTDPGAFAKCFGKILRLEAEGHALRRPEADYLEDGIYELRAKKGHVNYRILYFFHGQNVALLAHALTKKREIPPADLARTKERKTAFERNPTVHSYPHSVKGSL